MIEKKNSSLNASVCNAFDVINYLTGKGWCRIKDIATELNMDVAKAHRLLNTMETLEYIGYDKETRRYRLGLKFFSISYHMLKSNPLIIASQNPMEWAASQLFETINLGILTRNSTEMVHIYRLDGNAEAVRVDSPIGTNKSVHSSALGKCLIAYRPFSEQQSIAQRIAYTKFTDNTICSPEALIRELAITKERGYAIDDGEFNSNLFCVAMPIYSSKGTVDASISVTSLAPFTGDQLQRYLLVLKEASTRISINLGYRFPTEP